MRLDKIAEESAEKAKENAAGFDLGVIENWEGVTAKAWPASKPAQVAFRRKKMREVFGRKDPEKMGVAGIEGERYVTFCVVVDKCLTLVEGLEDNDGPRTDWRDYLREVFLEEAPDGAAFGHKEGKTKVRVREDTWGLFCYLVAALNALDDDEVYDDEEDEAPGKRSTTSSRGSGKAAAKAA